ncbi:Hypp8185 [Branchiostoma lanceolatum]|uniref:Hypp8185 protein n=1 Tax=Branchiostoma lanceolatum TaxID=7740 RepID=A0A8K0EH01_BRALA|nr:Hypp8185 [Branchiostoma lanceolatum]
MYFLATNKLQQSDHSTLLAGSTFFGLQVDEVTDIKTTRNQCCLHGKGASKRGVLCEKPDVDGLDTTSSCEEGSKEVVSSLVLWVPLHGKRKPERQSLSYMDALQKDRGLPFESLERAMEDRRFWAGRVISDEDDVQAILETTAGTSSDLKGHSDSVSPPKKKKKGMIEGIIEASGTNGKCERVTWAQWPAYRRRSPEKWRAYQKDTFAVAMTYTTG